MVLFAYSKNKRIFSWCVVIIYMLTMFIFSSQSGKTSNSLSNGVSNGIEITQNTIISGIGSLLTSFFLPQQDYENEEKENSSSSVTPKIEYKRVVNSNIITLNQIIRKLAHFVEYFILMALLYNALVLTITSCKKSFIISFIICSVYALLDEVHQLFVPGRLFLFTDVLIDISGAILFIILMNYFRKSKKGYKFRQVWE